MAAVAWGGSWGGLIHVASGIRGGAGSSAESFGAGGVGGVENDLALRADGGGAAVVDVGGGVEPDAGVAVLVVVVIEERVAEPSGVVDAWVKRLGEGGAVL